MKIIITKLGILYTKKVQDPSDPLQDHLGKPKKIPRERRRRPSRTSEEPLKNFFLFSAWTLAGGVWRCFANWGASNLCCADCTTSTPSSASSKHPLLPWGSVHSSSRVRGNHHLELVQQLVSKESPYWNFFTSASNKNCSFIYCKIAAIVALFNNFFFNG